MISIGVNYGRRELLKMLGSMEGDPNVYGHIAKELLNLRARSFTWLEAGVLLSPWPRSLATSGPRNPSHPNAKKSFLAFGREASKTEA